MLPSASMTSENELLSFFDLTYSKQNFYITPPRVYWVPGNHSPKSALNWPGSQFYKTIHLKERNCSVNGTFYSIVNFEIGFETVGFSCMMSCNLCPTLSQRNPPPSFRTLLSVPKAPIRQQMRLPRFQQTCSIDFDLSRLTPLQLILFKL